MIPTQPTPEEQVEAQRIANVWARHGDPAEQRLASAYLALLTQQSQERESCPVCKGEGRRIDGEVCGSCFGTGEL